MAIYKPSELRQFLNELDVRPKKGLSQNFLIDGNILRKIAKTAQVSSADLVLEIGSGPGSLSEILLESGARVIAVEKDLVFAEALERLKSEKNNLQIYCEDILNFPIEEVIKSQLSPNQKGKVIANLPYHLTTPILARLIPLNSLFSSLTLMVQEEVARRLTALPGTSEYSSLTVFLNYFCTPHYAFTVSKNCFYPVPNVQSAIVILDLKIPPTVSNQEQFFMMTRTTFQHRRKMIRSSLKELYPNQDIEKALLTVCNNPKIRPEELSLEQFIHLFELLQF